MEFMEKVLFHHIRGKDQIQDSNSILNSETDCKFFSTQADNMTSMR